MADHSHLVDLIVFEIPGRETNRLRECGRVVGHADKDEPGVLIAGDRCEPGPVTDDGILKGFFIGDGPQLAAIAKAPAMERADKDLLVAAFFGEQSRAAMRADVVERLHAFLGFGDDD